MTRSSSSVFESLVRLQLPSGAGTALLGAGQFEGTFLLTAAPAAGQPIGTSIEDAAHTWPSARTSLFVDLGRQVPGIAWVPGRDSEAIAVEGPLALGVTLPGLEVAAWCADPRACADISLSRVAMTRGDARFLASWAMGNQLRWLLTEPLGGHGSSLDRLRRLDRAVRALRSPK